MRSFDCTMMLGVLGTVLLISGPGGCSGNDTPASDMTTGGRDLTTGGRDLTTSSPDLMPRLVPYAALVRGKLFTTDLTRARTLHDMVAKGGEASSMAAGDVAHDVQLGTTLLGTTENGFLALDQWTDKQNMLMFYQNPDIQKAFGMLFQGAPDIQFFERQPSWHGWGDLKAGNPFTPHFFVVVRGRFKVGVGMQQHDMLAAMGEGPAKAAGDVAHVPFLDASDPREFFNIDIWKDSTNLAAFYSDPNFQAAFAALFETQPSVTVYGSTDWFQW